MSQKSTDDIKEFILTNHRLLTKVELANETGIAPATVRIYCNAMNINPITPRERACEYIVKHQHDKTQEEIAEKLEMISQHVRNYAKELGITLIRNCDKTKRKEVPAIKHDRPPAIYTQSGSDTTDKLRGIETTKRVDNSAQDAFFK